MRKGLKRDVSSSKHRVDQAQVSLVNHDQTIVVQKTLDKVTKERDDLSKRLEKAQREVEILKAKLCVVTEKVINSVKPCNFAVDKRQDLANIPEQDIVHLIETFTLREKDRPLEERIEELETRITLVDTELGKMLHLKSSIEEALYSLSSCRDLEVLQQGVRHLWLQSCSTKLFVERNKTASKTNCIGDSEIKHSHSNGMTMSSQINLETVEVPEPARKLPADTHIKDMQVDLREVIVRELSLFKRNGADWRMFAVRVGIPETLIMQWQQMKQVQPMRSVLGVWAASPGASVRMLHRHLVSPQMKCVVLAKRISDYYEVD